MTRAHEPIEFTPESHARITASVVLSCAAMPGGPPREARYANRFDVGINEAELIIDFAQAYEGEPPVFHTRIVTSPLHARELVAILTDALATNSRRTADRSSEE